MSLHLFCRHLILSAVSACLCISADAGRAQTVGVVSHQRTSNAVNGFGGAMTFVFDGRFIASGDLTFDFTRPIDTVDHDGNVVLADQPRYAPTRLVTSNPAIEQVRKANSGALLLGSGFDAQGVTPLLVVRDGSLLDVFTVADDALMQAESTGVGRHRTDMNVASSPEDDILQGAIAGRAYSPKAGVVCHGLIVLMCRVYHEITEDTWRPSAVAFVVSTDQGVTWNLHHEDESVQPGVERVREWSMQNWWPMDRGGTPLQAWFVGADYRSKPATTGGRILLFRATRTEIGAPWELEPVTVPIAVESGMGEHTHSAAVVGFGDAGIRVVAAVGDTTEFSRVITATRPDSDYTEAGWIVDEQYHGGAGDRHGYQFVGCAPGPGAGDILVGSDENGDQIHLLHPVDDEVSRAQFRHLYGHGNESGIGSRNFVIRTPTPELGGPYVATYKSGFDSFGDPAARLLYSENGLEWAEVFSPASHLKSPCIHGNHIYLDSRPNQTGLRRVGIPKIVRLRPLLIGSGGDNRMVSAPQYDNGESGNGLRLLTPEERAALDPQPPCLGPVFEVESQLSGSNLLANWRLAGENPDFAGGPFHLRMWCSVLGSDGSRLKFRARDGLGAQTPFRTIASQCALGGWQPVSFRDTLDPGGMEEPYLFTVRAEAGNADEPRFKIYLAFDSLTEGTGFPGYPLPPETDGPNELASISGFQCESAWTITMSGELPADLWDATTMFAPTVPLATLFGDLEEHIEIAADLENNSLLAQIYQNGALVDTIEFSDVFWLRGSQFRFSIAESGAGLAMTASVGSIAAVSKSSPVSLLTQPKSILLTPPVNERGQMLMRGNFAWHGGRIDPSTFLDATQRESLLNTLSFLRTFSGQGAGSKRDPL